MIFLLYVSTSVLFQHVNFLTKPVADPETLEEGGKKNMKYMLLRTVGFCSPPPPPKLGTYSG